MTDGVESQAPQFALDDEEFIDVDALYAEVRQLQRTLEQERTDANDTREKAFIKIRKLQQEVERQGNIIEKFKKLEAKYYALVAEIGDLRELAAAVRKWAAPGPSDARTALYQALALLDGRGSAGLEE